MLNQAALANSLAILTGAVYLLFYVISLVAPELFKHLFNAQFLGANVASLLPNKIPFGYFVRTLVEIKRIQGPLFNSKEAAERHGLQLCKDWINDGRK
jgi:hypothetical protein